MSGSGPAAPLPGHDFAYSSLHLDLIKTVTVVHCEAGFGAGNVAAHSCTNESQDPPSLLKTSSTACCSPRSRASDVVAHCRPKPTARQDRFPVEV
jgi:hypothetical protein